MCVCVCVNHLNRCKTSTCYRCRLGFLTFWMMDTKKCRLVIYFCRGTIHVLCAMVQRSGHSTCGYHGWSPWRTCQISMFLFLWHGNRLSQEPAWRLILVHVFTWFYTVVAIWMHGYVDFTFSQNWDSNLVQSGFETYLYLSGDDIWSLRGTWASTAWVLSISC